MPPRRVEGFAGLTTRCGYKPSITPVRRRRHSAEQFLPEGSWLRLVFMRFSRLRLLLNWDAGCVAVELDAVAVLWRMDRLGTSKRRRPFLSASGRPAPPATKAALPPAKRAGAHPGRRSENPELASQITAIVPQATRWPENQSRSDLPRLGRSMRSEVDE